MKQFKSKPEEPSIVNAIQLVEDIGYWKTYQYDENEWYALGKKGDWLVIDGSCQYFLTDKDFKEKFEEV